MKAYVEAQRGIAIGHLPAYAPDLNPVEYIWGYLKHHAMPNYCARDLSDVAIAPEAICDRCNAGRHLVTAFWKQIDLF